MKPSILKYEIFDDPRFKNLFMIAQSNCSTPFYVNEAYQKLAARA